VQPETTTPVPQKTVLAPLASGAAKAPRTSPGKGEVSATRSYKWRIGMVIAPNGISGSDC
jgi:hypothetical protein